jgi:peptidoglycan/xylan/chitin deacetylase (PgdA/CDA1 family)
VSPGSAGTIVRRGTTRCSRFALTFDDGPGACTGRVLDLLARWRARATFFLVGNQVQRHPDLAHRVRVEGHEVGSHSMTHLDHLEVEPERAVADMVDGAAAIERVLGFEPRLYRGPYGRFVPTTLSEAGQRGWTCVHWSASGNDWVEGETGSSIAGRVIERLAPGVIVLLHDSRRAMPTRCEPMLEALEMLLEEASRRGMEPVTVSELLQPEA